MTVKQSAAESEPETLSVLDQIAMNTANVDSEVERLAQAHLLARSRGFAGYFPVAVMAIRVACPGFSQ